MIKLYNTLTRQKEEFKPLEKGKVKMYVCGPTVYNFIHIGNARPLIVYDTVRNYLEYKGYDVTYVQNFTDVDDKIINKANELEKSTREIAETYIDAFYEDMQRLGVRRADIHPKVTENIEEIIQFVNELVEQDMAYGVDGDVYFRTEQFKGYGKLSKQSLDDLKVGARIEAEEKKEHPLDFALWKAAKQDEIAWESPWGDGRPGWHIECSTMVNKYLGATIDIHAGGADLIFPHHENEIAQSESHNHHQLANYWLHNGYINIDNEKMSKSLGNILTVKELLDKYDANVLRYLILSVHYRHPINFSEDLLVQSKNSIERIATAYHNLMYRMSNITDDESSETLENQLGQLRHRFEQEMDDDFNTANAMTVIFELVKQINRYLQSDKLNRREMEQLADVLEEWLAILGLKTILDEGKQQDEEWIQALIEQRAEAKKNRDFAKADSIRDDLMQKGILIEDTPQGVRWRRR